jgi:DNA invertase Pin-like site-specific DNA recombinase
MRAFVGPCPENFQVSHLNGDNADNRLINLRYESPQTNIRRKRAHGTQTAGENHVSAKLKWSEIRTIRRLLDSGLTLKEIADHYGVSFQQVWRIKHGHNWQESANAAKLGA